MTVKDLNDFIEDLNWSFKEVWMISRQCALLNGYCLSPAYKVKVEEFIEEDTVDVYDMKILSVIKEGG